MAKMFKAEVYFTDSTDGIPITKSELEQEIHSTGRWGIISHISNIEESDEFEWNDDLAINSIHTTTKDHEKYFKK